MRALGQVRGRHPMASRVSIRPRSVRDFAGGAVFFRSETLQRYVRDIAKGRWRAGIGVRVAAGSVGRGQSQLGRSRLGSESTRGTRVDSDPSPAPRGFDVGARAPPQQNTARKSSAPNESCSFGSGNCASDDYAIGVRVKLRSQTAARSLTLTPAPPRGCSLAVQSFLRSERMPACAVGVRVNFRAES